MTERIAQSDTAQFLVQQTGVTERTAQSGTAQFLVQQTGVTERTAHSGTAQFLVQQTGVTERTAQYGIERTDRELGLTVVVNVCVRNIFMGKSRLLTFRHRAYCILGQALHSTERFLYI